MSFQTTMTLQAHLNQEYIANKTYGSKAATQITTKFRTSGRLQKCMPFYAFSASAEATLTIFSLLCLPCNFHSTAFDTYPVISVVSLSLVDGCCSNVLTRHWLTSRAYSDILPRDDHSLVSVRCAVPSIGGWHQVSLILVFASDKSCSLAEESLA